MRKISSFIFISILIIGICAGCSKVNDKKTSQNINKYLSKNYSKILLGNDDKHSSFELLNKDLKKNEVFLTGESHGISFNAELDLRFIKYFKEKANIKYYLCEIPYSYSYFLNKYLNTGDKNILKQLFNEYKVCAGATKENYNKWIKIYEFNKMLPDDKKIKVIGIDVEYDVHTAIRCMYSLIPKKEPSEEIKPLIEKLQYAYENNKFNVKLVKSLSLSFKKDISKNYNTYTKYFGENFFSFNIVNENLYTEWKICNNNTNLNTDDSTCLQTRDNQMYKNFINTYNKLPKGKFYGHFGAYHTCQRGTYNDIKILASLMQTQKSPVKGKVISIVWAYNNCKIYKPYVEKIPVYNTLKEESILKMYTKTNFTLFKLNGRNSPFDKNLIWELLHHEVMPLHGVTTDYYQYIVVINNSPAMKPF